MKLLLDTHVLIWSAAGTLAGRALRLINKVDNDLYFSSASIWEIVIKRQLRPCDFQLDPYRLREQLLLHGYKELQMKGEHALEIDRLPLHHKDPFDRMLLAQARVESMSLLTADVRLKEYGSPVLYVSTMNPRQ